MSVVIAMKFNNGIIMASDRQVTRNGKAIKDSVNKIFRVGSSRFLVGGVGHLRELQSFKKVSKNLFTGILDLKEDSCVNIVDKLTIEYRNNLIIEAGGVIDSLDGEFILADAYNINYVGRDLSVVSNLDYFAIGCGEELVMGHLHPILEKKDLNKLDIKEAKKIVRECIKLSCKDDCYVDDNIDIIVNYKNVTDIVDDSMYELIDRCELEILGKEKLKSRRVCKNKCENCIHNIRFLFNKETKSIDSICSGVR